MLCRMRFIKGVAFFMSQFFAVGCTAEAQHTRQERPVAHLPLTSSTQHVVQVVSQFVSNKTKYDGRQLPPTTQESAPVEVSVRVVVKSIASLKEEEMDYFLDVIVLCEWRDLRLQSGWTDLGDLDLTLNHSEQSVGEQSVGEQSVGEQHGVNSTVPVVTLASERHVISQVWRPSLYFRNSRHTWRHDVLTGNTFLKIWPSSGRLLYSERVTVQPRCWLTLQDYPFDTQVCHLDMESFAYTTKQVNISWWSNMSSVSPLLLSRRGLVLPHLDFRGFSTTDCTQDWVVGRYSCVRASFHFTRLLEHHLLYSFLPSALIVCVSWVTFWLEPRSTAGRTILGITTLLTLSSLASGIQLDLPPVHYVKAIDVWVNVCTVFVFMSVVEFTAVSYVTRRGDVADRDDVTSDVTGDVTRDVTGVGQTETWGRVRALRRRNTIINNKVATVQVQEDPHGNETGVFDGDNKDELGKRIDRVSRVVFPLAFCMFCLIYWLVYRRGRLMLSKDIKLPPSHEE